MSGGAVLQDVFDKNAPHHLSVAQPAAHPSAPDDTDTQGLAGLPEELHSEEGVTINALRFSIFPFRHCCGHGHVHVSSEVETWRL